MTIQGKGYETNLTSWNQLKSIFQDTPSSKNTNKKKFSSVIWINENCIIEKLLILIDVSLNDQEEDKASPQYLRCTTTQTRPIQKPPLQSTQSHSTLLPLLKEEPLKHGSWTKTSDDRIKERETGVPAAYLAFCCSHFTVSQSYGANLTTLCRKKRALLPANAKKYCHHHIYWCSESRQSLEGWTAL